MDIKILTAALSVRLRQLLLGVSGGDQPLMFADVPGRKADSLWLSRTVYRLDRWFETVTMFLRCLGVRKSLLALCVYAQLDQKREVQAIVLIEVDDFITILSSPLRNRALEKRIQTSPSHQVFQSWEDDLHRSQWCRRCRWWGKGLRRRWLAWRSSSRRMVGACVGLVAISWSKDSDQCAFMEVLKVESESDNTYGQRNHVSFPVPWRSGVVVGLL